MLPPVKVADGAREECDNDFHGCGLGILAKIFPEIVSL
jgi:hypothetical protein